MRPREGGATQEAGWPNRRRPSLGGRSEEREVMVGEIRNLAPGTRAPLSGMYKCEFCGSGGWADTIAKEYKKTQRITLEDMEKRAQQGKTMPFTAGDEFPECTNCGAGTLWTLVESTEEDDD